MRTMNKWTPLGSVQSSELADSRQAQGKTTKCELRAKWTPLRSVRSSENQNLTVWGSVGEICETRTLRNMGPTQVCSEFGELELGSSGKRGGNLRNANSEQRGPHLVLFGVQKIRTWYEFNSERPMPKNC